jgi:hypothetical protein
VHNSHDEVCQGFISRRKVNCAHTLLWLKQEQISAWQLFLWISHLYSYAHNIKLEKNVSAKWNTRIVTVRPSLTYVLLLLQRLFTAANELLRRTIKYFGMFHYVIRKSWTSRHTTQRCIPAEPNLQEHAASNWKICIRHGVQLAQGKGTELTMVGPLERSGFSPWELYKHGLLWPAGSEPSSFYLTPFPRSTRKQRYMQPPKSELALACDDG